MKINRMSDDGMAPDWALSLKGVVGSKQSREASSSSEPEAVLPSELTEGELIDQRDLIEQCASSSESYRYSAAWSKNQKSDLREYALACGMDMNDFVEVEASKEVEVSKEVEAAQEDRYEKVASAVAETIKVAGKEVPTLQLNDPFGLDEVEDLDLAPEWEEVTAEKKLSDKPSMMTNAIKSIGGGEDYLTNSDVPLARNQNSIVNPSAIETLANSESEDTGTRLAREAREKSEAKQTQHQEWQQEKVDAMPDLDTIPRGSVFPTETMNAQSGLNSPSSQMGVYSKFDADSIPEKTQGELISEANNARRQKIQGEDKAKHEFKIQSEASAVISDDFTESLKKSLGL